MKLRTQNGALRRASHALTGRRVAAGLVAGLVGCALVAGAAEPPQALAKKPPTLIHNKRVDRITCVPGPAYTARARVPVWMSVVNYHGWADWADHMEVKVRLEATTAGVNYSRKWISSKTGYLLQDHRYVHQPALLSDNLSANAEWQVHIKFIWHRTAPTRNITKDVYKPFSASCVTPGGGAFPTAPAPPIVNGGS